MESIRARYASRINGTYTNEQQEDIFKSLGLYNNDSSSLSSDNAASTNATFLYRRAAPKSKAKLVKKGKKLPGSEGTYAVPDSFSWLEPYYPRDHAWTWPQYQVSNESAYLNDVPAGQHQYPYDTMESIRARYASRINGTYDNGQQTDIFKQLGLYNNDSSSL